MGLAAGSWEYLDGEAAMAGVDLRDLPPIRVANIVWARQRHGLSEDDWRKWLIELTRPLPGRKPTPALRDFRRQVLT